MIDFYENLPKKEIEVALLQKNRTQSENKPKLEGIKLGRAQVIVRGQNEQDKRDNVIGQQKTEFRKLTNEKTEDRTQ